MPSIRKTTGRAVTPVRQPDVASARQTQIHPPAIAAFPLPPGLSIKAEDGIRLLARKLEPPEIFAAGPPALRADAPPRTLPVSFESEPTPSLSLGFPGLAILVDRPPQTGRLTAGRPTGPLTPLRPLLAPGLFDQQAAHEALPGELGAEQVDVSRRLQQAGDHILIAPPGAGGEQAVCLALAEQLRARTIRSVLFIAPVEMHLWWKLHLAAWAPQVGVIETDSPPGDTGSQLRLTDFITATGRRLADSEADLVVLTAYPALRRRGGDPTALSGIAKDRRWVLAGGPPAEAEDWRLLHRYLHPDWPGAAALGEIQERLQRQTLRLGLESTAARQRRRRIEMWLELEGGQRQAYLRLLDQERSRLERLGGAVNRTHIEKGLAALKQTLAFIPGTLDGVKARALIDLTEEILAAGGRMIVFAPQDAIVLDGLLAILEAYGAVRLDSTAPEEDRARSLQEFRRPNGARVMVADTEVRGDGQPLEGVGYLVHFSHEWNPAHRRRAEQRLFPELGPAPPQIVLELWMADTVEAAYHSLLDAQGLLARNVAHETRPKDIEERLTIEDWLKRVFRVGGEAPGRPGTGRLPGTGALREVWAALAPEDLARAAEALMRALGFTQVERIGPVDDRGCDYLAWQPGAAGAERNFVRCLRPAAGSGVQAEDLSDALGAMSVWPECSAAYLLVAGEVSASARTFAAENAGRLTVVDGAEFYRHLKVLGLVDPG